MNLKLCVYNVT